MELRPDIQVSAKLEQALHIWVSVLAVKRVTPALSDCGDIIVSSNNIRQTCNSSSYSRQDTIYLLPPQYKTISYRLEGHRNEGIAIWILNERVACFSPVHP